MFSVSLLYLEKQKIICFYRGILLVIMLKKIQLYTNLCLLIFNDP